MENGVTLIEVMMIIAIIGMLTAMSIPRVGESLGEHAALTAARRIIADMRYARRLAITKANDHIVRFSPAGGPYTGYGIFRDGVQVGEIRQIPERVTCTGTEEFTFQMLGNASSDGAVSLSAGDSQYDVNVIATTGRAY
jgi:type II secretory pathway pseudopilin PulG